jgi:hypothetical protein
MTIDSFTAGSETDYRLTLPNNGQAIQRSFSWGDDWLSLRICLRAHLTYGSSVTTWTSILSSDTSLFLGVANVLDSTKGTYVGNICSKHLGVTLFRGNGAKGASTNLGQVAYSGTATICAGYTNGTSHYFPAFVGSTLLGLGPRLGCEISPNTHANKTTAVIVDLVTSKPTSTTRRITSIGACCADGSIVNTMFPITASGFAQIVQEASRDSMTLALLAPMIGAISGGANYVSATANADANVDLDVTGTGMPVFEISWGVGADWVLDVADISVIKRA